MEFQWLVGIVTAIMTGGILLWLKEIHGTLRDIREDLRSIAEFKGRVAEHMETTSRRLKSLELVVSQPKHFREQHG